MKVVTAAEMNLLDQKAVSDFHIPSLQLMENAARGLVDQIEQKIGPVAGRRITIVCGKGNNGGDGIIAARILQTYGATVNVYRMDDSFSFEALEKTLCESDIIIDALLGTGLSHPVLGHYQKVIDCINKTRRGNVPCEGNVPSEAFSVTVVSVDIPSGISADTGERFGVAVCADYTFTMGLPKRGLFLREGLQCRGAWDIIDIGFPEELLDQAEINVHLVGPADIKQLGWFSPRSLGAHKGTFGHLLIIAGSLGMKGSAIMASLSALRAGCGLVTVALPESIDSIAGTVMEAMTLPLSETKEGTLSLASEKTIFNAMEGKAAVAIGPGLSQNPETVQLILNLIGQTQLPMVIDADGINALASDLSLLKRPNRGNIILTPHPGEMGRLLGVTAETVQKDRMGTASHFAQKWGVIVVLKGAHTLVAAPDGSVAISNTGNPGMATAGAGDVLTGIIGGLLAGGMAPQSAAINGVVLHGLAGDIACNETGEIGLIASDIINKISHAIQKIKQGAS
jgi:NAD(P)H-hydrate epimerase